MQGERRGERKVWPEAALPWDRLIKADEVARLGVFLPSDASMPITEQLVKQGQNYVLEVRD